MGPAWRLEVGHMGYLSGLMEALAVPALARQEILARLRARNSHGLRAAALAAGLSAEGAEALAALLTFCGPAPAVLPRAEAACRNAAMRAAVAELRAALAEAGQDGPDRPVPFGGDGVLQRPGPAGVPAGRGPAGAAGAAATTCWPASSPPGRGRWGSPSIWTSWTAWHPAPPAAAAPALLNVALPKGRLGDKVYGLLAAAGCLTPEDYNATRKLVVEDAAAGVRCFLVKPSDVAIYVEHGAADLGIAGKDILAESEADVYELLDTGLGRCRMCVAGPAGFREDPGRPLRVATKFPRIAKEYYGAQGRDIEIIKLNGSIELAPDPGAVRRDRGHRGDRRHPAGKRPGRPGRVHAHFGPGGGQQGKLSVQAPRGRPASGPAAGGAGPKGGENAMMKLYRLEDLTPDQILNRDLRAEQDVEEVVDAIIADVRARGGCGPAGLRPPVRRRQAGRAGSVGAGDGPGPGGRRPPIFWTPCGWRRPTSRRFHPAASSGTALS